MYFSGIYQLFLGNVVPPRAHKGVTKSKPCGSVSISGPGHYDEGVWVSLQSFSPPGNQLRNASNCVSLLHFQSNFSYSLAQSAVSLSVEAVLGWGAWWSPRTSTTWEDRTTATNVKHHKSNALPQNLQTGDCKAKMAQRCGLFGQTSVLLFKNKLPMFKNWEVSHTFRSLSPHETSRELGFYLQMPTADWT